MSDETSSVQKRPRVILQRSGVAAVLIIILAWLFWPTGPKVSIRELLETSRDYYSETYDSIEQLATVLNTADEAVDFATNNISLSFYQGRLQSPLEVLKTRSANPADKAMFLHALLSQMNIKTQAYAAPLPANLRTGLVDAYLRAEKPLPDEMRSLMKRLDYAGDDINDFTNSQLAQAGTVFKNALETSDKALKKVSGFIELDGLSTEQPVFMDWVYLQDEAGIFYDPLLPAQARPNTARLYNETPANTYITVNAVNAYGDMQEIAQWDGAAYGTPLQVSFVPAIDTLDRLAGAPDMSDVTLWTPVLSVGDEHVLGTPVDYQGNAANTELFKALAVEGQAASFTAPQVNQLAVKSVNASAWPFVSLELTASVEGLPRWHPAHFNLIANQVERPVQLAQDFKEQSDALILFDQSGSMLDEDHYAWSQDLARSLSERMNQGQMWGLASFGNDPVFHKLFDAKPFGEKGNPAWADTWTGRIQGKVDFALALERALYAIEIEKGSAPLTPTKIVIITDGRTGSLIDDEWQKNMAENALRVETLKAQIYPVFIGSQGNATLLKLAETSGGRVTHVTQQSLIASTANDLVQDLTGGLTLKFAMPADSNLIAGDKVNLSLNLEGYKGTVSTVFAVPDNITAHDPGIYIGVNSGSHTTLRPIVRLGKHANYRQMAGTYQLFLAAGSYDINQVIASRLEDWLNYYDIRSGDQKALEEIAKHSRITSGEMQTINSLSMMAGLGGSLAQDVRYPLLALNRVYPSNETIDGEKQDLIITAMDVPAWGPLLANGGTKAEFAHAGLMLNSAEAALLGGSDLSKIFAEETIEDAGGQENLQSLLVQSSLKPGAPSRLLALASNSENETGYYWHGNTQSGQLRGFGIWDDLPLKGSRDVAIAAQFDRIQSAIGMYNWAVGQAGSAASALVGGSPVGGVAGVGLGGFIAFKSEELKLWCYSTIMLGYVGESISGEEDAILDKSVSAAEARAAKLCKMKGGPGDFGKNAALAAAKGFADTWANQFDDPLPEDPLGGVKDALDKASNIYKYFNPELKPGQAPPDRSRTDIFFDALNKTANGQGPSHQTQLVDKAFEWGASSFSPSFRDGLSKGINAEVKSPD